MEETDSANDQIILTEEELACMPVKDLNGILKGLPESEVLKLKQRRRTIKNRSYAQTSRSKRTKLRFVLENEKFSLETELNALRAEIDTLRRERDEARIKLEAFEKFAAISGIAAVYTTNVNDHIDRVLSTMAIPIKEDESKMTIDSNSI